ncbi:Myotubularin protein 7 [Fasciolopsis buskii]|uniref:Myotubularin protein 7 n=1 Tax=Fasciolopsis buskii TaxID=27845 RepID=A0A8E0RVV2_9TREM|nr:Myotubularin protein 7 [Fasciolopsis buski]
MESLFIFGFYYFPLLSQVNNVFYLDHFDGNAHILGTLHLTLTHVFFIGASRKQEIWLNNQLIASVERLPLTTGGAPIVVRGKNFRYIQLIIPRERDCHNVYITIKRLMSIESIPELPCFRLSPPECSWSRTDGWNTLDMETQLKRFGLPNSNWELTDVNKDFQASNLSVSAQTASVVCIIGREHRRDFLILCMRLANVQYDKCFVCVEYLFSGMHTVMYQTPVKTGLCLFDVLV